MRITKDKLEKFRRKIWQLELNRLTAYELKIDGTLYTFYFFLTCMDEIVKFNCIFRQIIF